MNHTGIWRIYEIEKEKIMNKGLSQKDYERQIRDLVDRLGI